MYVYLAKHVQSMSFCTTCTYMHANMHLQLSFSLRELYILLSVIQHMVFNDIRLDHHELLTYQCRYAMMILHVHYYKNMHNYSNIYGTCTYTM